jgi:hypothetical protein
VQGGRVEDPAATATNGGKWYAYPSIAVNSTDDVVFGFSQFSSAQFAAAGYTYRDHVDAAGTMRDPSIYKAGEDCYSKDFGTGRNRWGDFSHSMTDPTGDCAFWTIQEYAKLSASPTVGGSDSKWGTWWAKVNALACSPSVTALNFYTLFPCRIIDTRNPAGPLGGPSLTGGVSRTFVVVNQCSLPASATAIAVNVAETGAQGSGNLRVYPGGTSVPNASTINFSVGQTRANNAIVPLGASGDIAVYAGIGSGLHVDFILDIVGYFAP